MTFTKTFGCLLIPHTLIPKMPCCCITNTFKVKEQFCVWTPFDPKELDRKANHANSYEALPACVEVSWGEIYRVRKL